MDSKTILRMIEALEAEGYSVKRKGNGRGRIPQPTPCKCGVICASFREARMHCRKPRKANKIELEQI